MHPRSDALLTAAIALTRFGVGAKAGEIDDVAGDPQGWLVAQVREDGAARLSGEFENSSERVQTYLAYQRSGQPTQPMRRETTPVTGQTSLMAPETQAMDRPEAAGPQRQDASDARSESRRNLTQGTAREFLARVQLATTTESGFAERWALFWTNAFTVSATRFQAAIFIGQYEREAIRPHVFGRFEDLAVAAETHPAMLLYLDQSRSTGPNTRAGSQGRAGLNENLAREILELHTVGSGSGYAQADVTEFARALTGWSLPTNGAANPAPAQRAVMANTPRENGSVFRSNLHEPGARTVLGKRYSEGGAGQAEAILRDLANRPETARRLARNLARHFVADDPPPALVSRLEATWITSRGDLAQVARALVTAPEAWDPRPAKMKTPYEFLISSHRALGTEPQAIQPLQNALAQMGQPAFSAPSPEGWPDTAADWAGPDAMVKRLSWAWTLADTVHAADPNAVAAAALGPRLSDRSRSAVARAESRHEALTLFLMSPEFQRR